MQQPNSQNFILDYELAIDSTPEEVRDFLWSDAYKGIIAGIVKTCNLTIEQGEAVSTVMFDLTINATDEMSARTALTRAGISEDNQEKIFLIGYEYIINPSITEAEETTITESSTDTLDGGVTSSPTTTPSAQSETLTNLATRLTSPSILAPTKRDYSITNTAIGDTQPTSTTSSTKTLDPYREAPEK
ncbi:hypothetical protein K2Q02_02565 [Patescibacteria group bacterium]|nr:hypothetical protein [Patescibacteria group bacterium]